MIEIDLERLAMATLLALVFFCFGILVVLLLALIYFSKGLLLLAIIPIGVIYWLMDKYPDYF